MFNSSAPIAVLGCGTWGVTLGSLLTWQGHETRVWDLDSDLIAEADRARMHPKLPALEIPNDLRLIKTLDAAISKAETIVVATPANAVRAALTAFVESPALAERGELAFILASKGIEVDSLKLAHEVACETLGEAAAERIAVLSGPSHAEEVCHRSPTTIVAAATNPKAAEYAQELFHTPDFRVYTQTDVLGVELGGALKNVIAIATGACDGLGLGDNTRAALITRGLAEMTRLGVAMGAEASTFAGLSGVGDLIVTATSVHSRNRLFGELLVSKSPEEAQAKVGMVVEGVTTARAAVKLAERHRVEMPVTEAVAAVVDRRIDPRDAVGRLMTREAKSEREFF